MSEYKVDKPAEPLSSRTNDDLASAVQGAETGKPHKEKVGALRMFEWQSSAVALGWNILILTFLSIYATDTLQLPAALVGTLLLVSKLIDAVTDLTLGYVVDRTNTRWGRARPYQWSIVGMWLCTWLMYSASPEWEQTAKAIWVFMMYTLVSAVFQTFLNASTPVYLARAFPSTEQHVAIQTYGGIIPMVFAVFFNITFPIAMAELATSAAGWSKLVAIFALPVTAFGMLRFFTIKETVDVDAASDGKVSLRDAIRAVKNNKYVTIVSVLLLVFNLTTNMGVAVYFYKYVLNNVALMGAVAAIQVIAIPLAMVFPAFIRRYSVRKLITAGLLVAALGSLVIWLANGSFALVAAGAVLVGAGNIPINMLPVLMILECADYNEWKNLPRFEGTMGGITGFATKLGAALGAGILGWLLSLSGYVGDGAPPESAITMIRLLYSLIPMALYLGLAALMQFYNLDTLLPKIREENQARRASRSQ